MSDLHESLARMARSGLTGTWGKNDQEARTTVSDAVASALAEHAQLTGRPKAEAHRQLLEEALMGRLAGLPRRFARSQQMALDEAVAALATVNGLTREEFIEAVLVEYVFGRLHIERLLAAADRHQSESAVERSERMRVA